MKLDRPQIEASAMPFPDSETIAWRTKLDRLQIEALRDSGLC